MDLESESLDGFLFMYLHSMFMHSSKFPRTILGPACLQVSRDTEMNNTKSTASRSSRANGG